MPSAFKQTCICRKAKRKKVGELGWRGRVGGGGYAQGRETGSHSFTHNFLETEWGCLHKAKKRMMARKDFVAVHFPIENGRGGGVVSLEAIWHKKNTNLMKRRTLNFPTTKSSCGTRWGKNGRSGSILAWRMDDGWWGHQRKKFKEIKQQPQQNKKRKKSPHWAHPSPNVKQKQKAQILSNPAAGSKLIQKRDVHMCITGEKNNKKTKCNRKETNIMSCNCSYDWKQGKEWEYEFLCQHGEMYSMYECVWLHMLPLYEGRVPCSLQVKNFFHYTLLHFHFWEYLGLRFEWFKETKHVRCKNLPVQFQ